MKSVIFSLLVLFSLSLTIGVAEAGCGSKAAPPAAQSGAEKEKKGVEEKTNPTPLFKFRCPPKGWQEQEPAPKKEELEEQKKKQPPSKRSRLATAFYFAIKLHHSLVFQKMT